MNKLEKLRAKMRELSVESVIIIDELNQHYLSEFAFTDGFLLITLNKAYLVTDFRYFEMAKKGANPEFEILTPDDRRAFIDKALAEEGIKTVGFEGNSMSYCTYRSYCDAHKHLTFVNIGDTLEVIRQVKTKEELAKHQKAQDITDKAFLHILDVLDENKGNMTEQEVAAELEYAMRRNGATNFAFETICVSGSASSLPHGKPRNVKLERGFLTMDFGAQYDGYCADMTRTVCIGKADADIKKVYNTVLKAQLAGIDFYRDGADCGEADKVARDIIDAEYKGTFGHSLGHSVGLFIHENPRISFLAFGTKMRTGNVVTCEPGIYIYGKYGCRIEDMLTITDNGSYDFAHSTKDFIEIY